MGIADPLKEGNIYGFFYIFQSKMDQNGQYFWKQDAGQKRVNYTFYLTNFDEETGSNSYFDAYKVDCDDSKDVDYCADEVMNPEDTWLYSGNYQRHYAENW